MSNGRHGSWFTAWIVVAALSASASAQSKGTRAISASDMKPYLAFLGSKEFRGRSAPAAEFDIASKYIAVEAARIGLKPLMPGGSYFQDVPVEVTQGAGPVAHGGQNACPEREGRPRDDLDHQPRPGNRPGEEGPQLRCRRAAALPRCRHGQPGAASGRRGPRCCAVVDSSADGAAVLHR